VGDAGLIFPEGRADLLREHLARLMRDAELRAELARRGRERVLQNYTQAQVAKETYQVYSQILAGT